MLKLERSRYDSLVIRAFNEFVALRLPVNALIVLFFLLISICLLVGFSMTKGSYPLSLSHVWSLLQNPSAADSMTTILWEFRIPRALAAALVGAMLALSGASLQNITRNHLADPSLVGISQGAALAVVAFIVLLPEQASLWRPWAAFFGSLIVATGIQVLSLGKQGNNPVRFILIGIGFSAFTGAATSALMTYGKMEQAMSALSWLSGSINAVNWDDVRLLFTWFMVLFPLLLVLSRSMGALKMGDEMAVGFGVTPRTLHLALISVAVGLAAICAAVVGPLGFIGLIAPHIARRLAHCGVGMHLILSAAVGAIIVILADLAGRSLFLPVQIPAGVVTAIIGVPIFILLLQRSSAKSSV